MEKSLISAISCRFLLLSTTIVQRITLPITVTKRQVVKAVPWIKTASGNLGIRSASLYQVGTACICIRKHFKFTQSKSGGAFYCYFWGFYLPYV